MTCRIICGELEGTLLLGEKLGRRCKGSEVFELISDLGGGKTAFVRGLARGMGISEDVSSPSFTINNTYSGIKLVLEHFDFYRLEDAGVLADQLHEDLFMDGVVTAVEWGDIVSNVLPQDKVTVTISVDETEARTYIFSYPPTRSYLFESVA